MPNFGAYTHAIISRVHKCYETDKSTEGTGINYEKAKSQQECLVRALRDLKLDVLELPPDEESPASVFVNDCAVILQGTALMCRLHKSRKRDVDTVRAVLKKELGLIIEELDTESALLNASDVLFTGKEFFIGIGMETNLEGALNVARTWPEYPCIPIQLEVSRHFLDMITLGSVDVLAVSSTTPSQTLLKKLERETTHSYRTLTVPEEHAANCLFINGTLLHVSSVEAAKSAKVFEERIGINRLEMSMSEFQKIGRGLSSMCLLIKQPKNHPISLKVY